MAIKSLGCWQQPAKILGAFGVLLLAFTSEAPAQQSQAKTFYDAQGRVVGRSSTDSQGSTTFYDASGKVTGRTSTSGSTTTIYDPSGRNVGRTTTGTR